MNIEIETLQKAASILREHGMDATAAFCLAAANKLVPPSIEVGQVWRHKKCPTKWTMEILCVGNDRVFVRNENGYECSWEISMLTANYTLQTPAPEVVALTADDVSDGVYGAWIDERCKEIVYETKKQYEKRFLAAAINKFNEEKACG